MGLLKNIEYAMFCVNWVSCNGYEDYKSDIKSPKRHFEKLGYRLINGVWHCKECANKSTKQDLTDGKED